MENNSKYLLIDKKVQEYFASNDLTAISLNLNKIIRAITDFSPEEMIMVSRTTKYIGSLIDIKLLCLGMLSSKSAEIVIEHSECGNDENSNNNSIIKTTKPKIIVDTNNQDQFITYQLEFIGSEIKLTKINTMPKTIDGVTYSYR